MVRNTRSLKWTALAAATAMIIAPVAYAGSKAPGFLHHAAAARAAATPHQQPHDRFIVTYRDEARLISAASARQQLSVAGRALGVGIQPMRTLGTGAKLILTDRKLDTAASKRLIVELMKNPNVLAVEPDRFYHPLMAPNDPGYAQQWHYQSGPGGINAEPAWDLSTGAGVVVAVLDTGSTPHSELINQYVAGYDFIKDTAVAGDGDGRDADPNDVGDWTAADECGPGSPGGGSSWHGTHVAGTIAAATNNGVGVAGVAFDAKVQPVRVLGKCGGYLSDIIDAVTWSSGGSVTGVPDNPTPAEVINLSLGGGGSCSVAGQEAFDAAVARGTTVVVAAGNSAADAANFSPASCDNVIAVSAVGPSGTLAGYSNYGATVEVAAPGGSGASPAEDNILSTLNDGAQGQGNEAYAWYAGTSMASPHVAGVVALMQAAAVDAGGVPKTPAEITEILVNTAYASGGFPAGCSSNQPCGSGIIDARYAVAVAAGLEPLPDAPPPPPPPPPAIQLENGVTVTDISVEAGGKIRYQLQVPNGAENLLFAMYGGEGDADLYVRYGAEPTDSEFDCRPFAFGNDENCFFPAPQGGTWYVTLKGFSASSGVSLYPSFIDNNWPRAVVAEVEQHRRRTRVNLEWEAGKRFIDIYRNGAILKTVRNRGHARDTFRIIGSGAMSYILCNNGTDECADPVTIEYDTSDTGHGRDRGRDRGRGHDRGRDKRH